MLSRAAIDSVAHTMFIRKNQPESFLVLRRHVSLNSSSQSISVIAWMWLKYASIHRSSSSLVVSGWVRISGREVSSGIVQSLAD